MPITSALVLFAVIWFLTLFIILPLRLQTQGDVGKIEPGTHAGSPENPQMKKRFMVTTVVALVIWVIVAGRLSAVCFPCATLIGSTGWQRPKSLEQMGEGGRAENRDKQSHQRNSQGNSHQDPRAPNRTLMAPQ